MQLDGIIPAQYAPHKKQHEGTQYMVATLPPPPPPAVESAELLEMAHEAAQLIFQRYQLPGEDIPLNVVLRAALEAYSPAILLTSCTLPLWLIAVGVEIGEYRAHGGFDWTAPQQ